MGASPRDVSRRPGSRLRRHALAACCSLLASFLGLELALRAVRAGDFGGRELLYQPDLQTNFAAADSLPALLQETLIGYRPQTLANDFRLNTRSLKTREYTTQKAPGLVRILALGDSFTFASGGVPHRELWHQLLERSLSGSSDGPGGGRPLEVLNLGMPAVAPDFYLRMWQLEGRRLEADLVLVGFFVGNDLPVPEELVRESAGERWGRRSFVVRLVRNAWILRGRAREPVEPVRAPPRPKEPGVVVESMPYDYDRERPAMEREAFLEVESRFLRVVDRSRREVFEARVERAVTLLASLAGEVRAEGAELVVALFPERLQLEEALLEEVLLLAELDAAEIDLEAPQRALNQRLEALGIPVCDLLPAFRRAMAEGPERALYRVQDTHWNEAGNALAAEELDAFLRSRGWGP